eukprot:6486841-Pyramimonas_sp.AAC.1
MATCSSSATPAPRWYSCPTIAKSCVRRTANFTNGPVSAALVVQSSFGAFPTIFAVSWFRRHEKTKISFRVQRFTMGLEEHDSSLDEFVVRASSAPRSGRHNSPDNALHITMHRT